MKVGEKERERERERESARERSDYWGVRKKISVNRGKLRERNGK